MKKTVRVVFTKDIEKHLLGDEEKVALGYARNYLFPQKIAVKADDPKAQKIIEKLKRQRED